MNTRAAAISDSIYSLAGQVEALDAGTLAQWQRTLLQVVAATLRHMADMLHDAIAVDAA